MVRAYISLLRVKHYVKNLLIFFPLFFAQEIFVSAKMISAIWGFVAFSAISSAVYILNDLKDAERDRQHPVKRNRPIASGCISKPTAVVVFCTCILIALSASLTLHSVSGLALLILYFCLNIAYSCGLKKKPIIDIVILASGFVIRVFYGGVITGISISKWLFLVIVTGSLYMGLGKRRNELQQQSNNTRDVLKYYNAAFLDKNMYMFVALTNVFYALWTVELSTPRMIWTVPIFMVILMCYSLDTEGRSDGDPTEVILHNRALLALIALYGLFVFSLLYIF